MLAGDHAAAEAALRRGYEELGDLQEVGHRASVAAMLARTLQAQGQTEEAAVLVDLVEGTASEHDIWSQVLYRITRARLLADAGRTAEADRVALTALAIVESTDLLDLHGDVLLELAEVQRSDGRNADARASVEQALALYERKANAVAAERARQRLRAGATTA
jgi:hypothetical protein